MNAAAFLKTGFWQDKTVVVTGAGGFIGSHLTQALVHLGAKVTALVKYNGAGHWGHLEEVAPNLPDNLKPNLTVVLGDITDPAFVQHLTQNAQVVFHLAALIGIPYSYVAPHHYVQTNVTGTLNVLQACRQNGVAKLVHTSTSEAYGTALFTPISEAHPLQGQSPYSASKIAADKLAESYHLSFELPVATIRPFNTFGPRQSARAFIPTVISQALSQPVIKVGDLTPKRDLNFVSDTVNGFLAVAENPASVGKLINIGSGRSVTMGYVLEVVQQLTGTENKPVEAEAQRIRPEASEVKVLECDATLAQTLLGWHPQVSLEEGLAQTVKAIEATLSRYKPTQYAV